MGKNILKICVLLIEIIARLAALENIMLQKGICTTEDIEEKINSTIENEPTHSILADIDKALTELERTEETECP